MKMKAVNMTDKELPPVYKSMMDICMAPYKLSDEAMKAVTVVCCSIYRAGLLEGYNKGHSDMFNVNSAVLQGITSSLSASYRKLTENPSKK